MATPKRKFQRGDVVRLNSGGPEMTVREEKKGLVGCDWFDGNQTHHEAFYVEQLTATAMDLSDFETARRIATLLRKAATTNTGNPPPADLDALVDTVLKDEPPR